MAMAQQASVDTALETLRSKGLRVTPQRKLILQILDDADTHLDANAVYQRARERDRAASMATVYRTLNVLLDAGLVQQRFFDANRNRAYYERNDKEHFHFTCTTCGKVIEFETKLVAQLCNQLRERYGLYTQHVSLQLEGTCSGKLGCADCPTDEHPLCLKL
ncbi:MAG: transcriptional repressor [Anaerolineae bacterium]|nr:transcriptional repressor [Anaerolineae bacterium]